MIYTRDLPAGHTAEQLTRTHEHVRDHLAAVADRDDNPDTHAGRVHVAHQTLPDGGMRIVGTLDAEPDAPYLDPGFDPYEGVDPELARSVLGG